MTVAAFYERRKENRPSLLNDRRVNKRRNQVQPVTEERRCLASPNILERRSHPRYLHKIPLINDKAGILMQGISEDISHGGLSISVDGDWVDGSEYCLRFVQSDFLSLDISGAIVYQNKTTGRSNHRIGIKFCESSSSLEKEVLLACLSAEVVSSDSLQIFILPPIQRQDPTLRLKAEQWEAIASRGPAYSRDGDRRVRDRRKGPNVGLDGDRRKGVSGRRGDRRSSEPKYRFEGTWGHSLIGNVLFTLRDLLLHLLPVPLARLFVSNIDFVFMAHFRDLEDVPRKFPYARYLPKKLLEKWLLIQWPIIGSYITGFRLKDGSSGRGVFVLIPLTGKQIMQNPSLAEQRVAQAARLSEKIGARVIGLGAFTSIVTSDGIGLERFVKGSSLTTGTAFSAAIAIQNLFRAADLTGLVVKTSKIAIVGAAGSVGSACAKVLSVFSKSLILVDLNTERLGNLVAQIQSETTECLLESGKTLDLVSQADVVIVVTNAPGVLIRSKHVKSGAIVIDCAQPRNVSNRISVERPDVLVVESAVVRAPGIETNIDMGLANNEVFGCLAESMILAWLGWSGHFSLGKVGAYEVNALNLISKQMGFSLAHLRNANGYVSESNLKDMKNILRAKANVSEEGKASL